MIAAPMVIVIGLLSVAAFMAVFMMSGLVKVATGALGDMQGAMAVMQDASLDDDAKERAVQQASLKMFAVFGGIVVRAALALAASAAPILLADWLGLASHTAVIAFLSRWDVIIGLSVILTVVWLIGERVKRAKSSAARQG